MGCGSSKPHKSKCKHCKQAPYPAVSRSYSMFVHHPPSKKGDSYHVVALTSTTLGSLHLDHSPSPPINPLPHLASFNSRLREEEDEDDDYAKKKSEFEVGMMEAKAWSKMIDEKMAAKTAPETPPETINAWEMMEGLEDTSPRTSGFDTEVISPTNPFRLHPRGARERVVVYSTSLRGIRKTYEECCEVRVILRGLGVSVDERDVSMHSAFKEELRELLGDAHKKGGRLPRVFVGDEYIGGADEIRRMHEDGALQKVLERCEFVQAGGCDACADVRFVPCETCSGSCKVYYEDEEEEGEFGFQRCPDCNYFWNVPSEVSCYKCGQLGHTGLACYRSQGEKAGEWTPNSCFKCGQEGHFSRECKSTAKAKKRNRDLTTPKKKALREGKVSKGYKSAPQHPNKARKKRKLHLDENLVASSSKRNVRGGWIMDDPGDFSGGTTTRNRGWQSPSTPSAKKYRTPCISTKRHTSSFGSSRRYNNSPVERTNSHYGYSRTPYGRTPNSQASSNSFQHGYTASRFGNPSAGGLSKENQWW